MKMETNQMREQESRSKIEVEIMVDNMAEISNIGRFGLNLSLSASYL